MSCKAAEESRGSDYSGGTDQVETSVQPESGIHSYQRRKFIRKAALATAAVGIGSTILGDVIPESSAKSSFLCYVPVSTCIANTPGRLAVWSCTTSLKDYPCTPFDCTCHGAYLCGAVKGSGTGICATLVVTNKYTCTAFAPVGVAGLTEDVSYSCWPKVASGVLGAADYGAGVSGSSMKGFGVLGSALGPCAIPVVAQGATGQKAPIQNWNCSSVVASNGHFGIGTKSPKTLLDVNGTIYGSQLGLGTKSPTTTLKFEGSLSVKVATTSGNYPMGPTDFAVLANAASAALTVTLPVAGTASGMVVFVKKTDSTTHVVTVEGAGSGTTQDKIEGATSKTLSSQYASLTLISNGVAPPGAWFILGNAT